MYPTSRQHFGHEHGYDMTWIQWHWTSVKYRIGGHDDMIVCMCIIYNTH